jgi:hypothetical protein
MRTVLALGLTLALASTTAIAFSMIETFVREPDHLTKEKVERYDWPEGVLEFVNNPFRTIGKSTWWHDAPNDTVTFEFNPAIIDELNDLIAAFGAIESDSKRIQISPLPEHQVRVQTIQSVRGGNPEAVPTVKPGTLATFRIGSQRIKDAWYEKLPETEPGVREWGVHRYTESPTAAPPTLTIYVGNPSIDLSELQIPKGIETEHAASEKYRSDRTNDPLLTKIDEFVTTQ